MALTGSDAYYERVRLQALAWAEGRPYHNRIDDECCPDFSCCHPQLFDGDPAKRGQYYHERQGRLN